LKEDDAGDQKGEPSQGQKQNYKSKNQLNEPKAPADPKNPSRSSFFKDIFRLLVRTRLLSSDPRMAEHVRQHVGRGFFMNPLALQGAGKSGRAESWQTVF